MVSSRSQHSIPRWNHNEKYYTFFFTNTLEILLRFRAPFPSTLKIDQVMLSLKRGMSTTAFQFLTEALTGTLRAHKGQSVCDSPHLNRMCLKRDEDFYKPEQLFLQKKKVSENSFFLSFSSWRCGNQGCRDDSKCGIGCFDEVTPLFTVINRLDGGDLFGPAFLR